MQRILRAPLQGARVRFISTKSRFPPAATLDLPDEDIGSSQPNAPAVLKKRFCNIPAISKWFSPSAANDGFHELRPTYLETSGSAMVPLELTRLNTADPGEQLSSSFERFEAPLSLLLSHVTSSDKSLALYLAQCSLDDLPPELRDDLPTPHLLTRIGRGDVYNSSLWMGRPPTKTPLHRDPNPNLFVQLAGRKVIRMIEPDQGKMIYHRLSTGKGHANMRGEEMMAGLEMERLEQAIWGDDIEAAANVTGVEATLESGDALFIPSGWWHAVHGVGKGVNASVNWWFR